MSGLGPTPRVPKIGVGGGKPVVGLQGVPVERFKARAKSMCLGF